MAIFPTLPGLMWNVHKQPIFSTRVQTSRSGRETRAAYWSYPIYRFELRYEFLRDDRSIPANQTGASPAHELKTLLGFFLQRRGSYEAFNFDDPTDDTIADAVRQTIVPASIPSVTDYVVSRAYGGFVEPVGFINAMSLYVNGVLQSGGSYQKNVPYDGWIRFNSAPSAGLPITWSGTFMHRVRFAADEADFDNFLYDLWELRKCELRTAKV